MTRRGRRPHPDILTPREWEVLTLLREQRSNPEIAEELGVSRDAVKYHVSEILSKLGLSTREEAAAWDPEPPERPVFRPAWASAFGPLAAVWRAWPLALRIAGGAVVAAAVVGVGVLAYGVARSGGDDDGAVTQTTPSATPRVVFVQPGDTIRVLTYGSPPTDATTCEEIFTYLDVKPNDAQTNPVTCTIGFEAPRLTFVDTGNGVLRLSAVSLVMLGTAGPSPSPQDSAAGPSSGHECSAISAFLFDGSQDPSTAPLQISCNIPLSETGTASTKIVWAHVNPDTPDSPGPGPCWLLAPAAGGVGDGVQQKPVQCLLDVPAAPNNGPQALTVQPAVPLPPNLAVVMEIGCCETPLTGLVGISNEDGNGLREVLFSAGSHIFNTADGSLDSRDEYEANGVTVPTPKPQASAKAPAEDRPYVATYGVSQDSQAMAVGLCIRGACEGVNAAPNDQGITQLYLSLDRGQTWSELVQLGPYVRIVGVTSAGRVLIANNVLDTKEEEFSWQPDGEVVPLPSLNSDMPTVLSDGRLIWPSLGNWYLDDGSLLARDVPDPGVFNPIIDMGDGRFAVNTSDGFAIVESGAVSVTYAAAVAAYLGDGQFVGMTTVPAPSGSPLVTAEAPALIDINARTITPVTSPFLDPGFDQPGFQILAGAYLIHTPPSGL